jgi:hypothetical protein
MSLKDILEKSDKLLENGVTVKVGCEEFTIKKVFNSLKMYDFYLSKDMAEEFLLKTQNSKLDDAYEPVTPNFTVKSLPFYGINYFLSDLFYFVLGERNISEDGFKMIKRELNSIIEEYNLTMKKYKSRDHHLNHILFNYILPGAILFIDKNYKDNMINLSVIKCDLCKNIYDIMDFIDIKNTPFINDNLFYTEIKHLKKNITNINICNICYENFLDKRQLILNIFNS